MMQQSAIPEGPSSAEPSRYDLVSYPSYTHPQTHPDRLAVIGSLFGMNPARLESCRVLELGCGDGSNLIPMAAGLSGSEFLGLDLAARPVSRGQQAIRDLGMANVRLVHNNLTEINGDWGKFDYIIAHGVFSWVPVEFREHLLRICRNSLAPHGIAFVSYNTFPGCHLRNMLREIMLFHVRGFDAADEKVRQAQALVKFLVEAQDTGDEYRLWMKAELETIRGHDDGHLYHDELADISEPFYFTQFIERASAHGLQYLAEADYFEMFDYGFKEPTRQILNQLGRNRILREQYLDFLKCRRFRQTLLCHRETELQATPRPEPVAGFWISSPAQSKAGATDLDMSPGTTVTYETPKGARCATDFVVGKAALAILQKNRPVPVQFHKLLQEALLNTGSPAGGNNDTSASETLSAFLLDLYSAGIVEFRAAKPRMVRETGERPAASPLARWQAQRGDFVTTQFHTAVKVEDEIGRCLLSSLDGTLDRKALLEKLWLWLRAKDALVLADGNEAAARTRLGQEMENNLIKLARMGLLVE
jgi:methyltransferase-like protein/2-polyprenyl-3-methyl-5-hydroxy-6-metoxy-1,4-benzoquinol methylase